VRHKTDRKYNSCDNRHTRINWNSEKEATIKNFEIRICRCQFSIKMTLADNGVSSGLIRYFKLVPDSFSNTMSGYSITELNSTSPSTSELGDLVDEVDSDEANARHPLYARCHLHDTSGSPSREFHRERDKDKRGEWRGSDRAARHVSGNIIRHISRVSLSYCFVSVCMLFCDHLLCRIPECKVFGEKSKIYHLRSIIKIR